MSATKKQPTITDVAAILNRVIEEKSRPGAPFTAYQWDRLVMERRGLAGKRGTLVKQILEGRQRSPTLDSLDEAAQAVGYGDFIEMASGAPRFDLELVRDAVVEVVDVLQNGPFEVSAEDAAGLVVAILQHYTRHPRSRHPGELRDRLEFTLTHSRTKQAAG